MAWRYSHVLRKKGTYGAAAAMKTTERAFRHLLLGRKAAVLLLESELFRRKPSVCSNVGHRTNRERERKREKEREREREQRETDLLISISLSLSLSELSKNEKGMKGKEIERESV
jgi:hypothetical protein